MPATGNEVVSLKQFKDVYDLLNEKIDSLREEIGAGGGIH